jgi:ferric-dicitrate binding protein FerR (iron transport regulator)
MGSIMKTSEEHNRLIDVLLRELVGGEVPPDLTVRILAKASPRRRQLNRFATAALATAAIIMIAALGRTIVHRYVMQEQVGRLHKVHGMIRLTRGSTTVILGEGAPLLAGQWIEALSGSEAVLVLNDASRLRIEPRTFLQVEPTRHGDRVVVERGFVRVTATEQAQGRRLLIATPGAVTRVLGTTLGVRVSGQADGKRHTYVRVKSGEVEMEAGDAKVLLGPTQEGLVEDGSPPLRRSITPEFNELMKLMEVNKRMNVGEELPSIIDFGCGGNATVWTAIRIANNTQTKMTEYVLNGTASVSGVKACDSTGAVLPTTSDGRLLTIDLTRSPLAPGEESAVLLKVPHVRGLLKDEAGSLEFSCPSGDRFALLQLRLPAGALINHLSPAPIETRVESSRKVITVVANAAALTLFEQ